MSDRETTLFVINILCVRFDDAYQQETIDDKLSMNPVIALPDKLVHDWSTIWESRWTEWTTRSLARRVMTDGRSATADRLRVPEIRISEPSSP